MVLLALLLVINLGAIIFALASLGADKMQGFSVTDLCAWYGEKQVLSNINMQIPGQGVTAIIGPSGCGKSTFIRCLNRMHEAGHGCTHGGGDPPG